MKIFPSAVKSLRLFAYVCMVWMMGQSAVWAAEFKDFDAASFAAAQEKGAPILLDVHAWWCPVCASQARTIAKTTAAPEYKDLIVFRINYDKQKAIWKGFGVQKQSTLIGFKGKEEVGRISFTTNKMKINDLLASVVR